MLSTLSTSQRRSGRRAPEVRRSLLGCDRLYIPSPHPLRLHPTLHTAPLQSTRPLPAPPLPYTSPIDERPALPTPRHVAQSRGARCSS
jgi:hypothetical protein